MKLLDFLVWSTFNDLRLKMGAPLVEQFGVRHKVSELVLPDIERLQTEGIDVTADEIRMLDDGTLAYRDHRVLVYIRDIQNIVGRDMPKYHFAHCRTLKSMYKKKQGERYVVANSETGLFHVNIIDGYPRAEKVALNVCQNCLEHIRWNRFDMQMPQPVRLAIVEQFRLTEFFKRYPRDLMSLLPKHSSDTAPINMYTDDWAEVSNRTRSARGFMCEKCNLVLPIADARYLHVHHRNGQKHDNRDDNLEVLCVGCHAEEPLHEHMKRLPEYQRFMERYRS
jgi:hypothetical protein